MRPSHHKITQLLTEGNPKKNASLTNSALLQELKTKRDDALTKSLMPTPDEEGLGNENAKKQKPATQTMDMVVQIDVGGTMVHCLCPKSGAPTMSSWLKWTCASSMESSSTCSQTPKRSPCSHPRKSRKGRETKCHQRAMELHQKDECSETTYFNFG